MKNYIKYILLVFLYSIGVEAQQQVISKADAVAIALENNYGIKIADNNLKIAKNNKGVLNSGYLPTLTGNSGATYTQNDIDAVFRDGSTTSLTRAESRRYNASLNLNYTLFDGNGRRYNYKQLKEQYNLTELQARETIENTIMQLFAVYYDVAQLTENVSLLTSTSAFKTKSFVFCPYSN
jgi:outer membrane protein TolC